MMLTCMLDATSSQCLQHEFSCKRRGWLEDSDSDSGAQLQRALRGRGFLSWEELAELPDQLFIGIARFESRNFVIHLVLSRVS